MGALALGRFVFLPFHRASLAKAGLPKQNDQTHFAAGDARAEEASFVLKVGSMPDQCARGQSAWHAGMAAACPSTPSRRCMASKYFLAKRV